MRYFEVYVAGIPGMDGVDEVDESLGHDETQDEAHADDYGIGRGTHPAKEEVRTRYMGIRSTWAGEALP